MQKFAIVDLETTGIKPHRDKIIEIAIILHDGHRELDRWQSLINPETFISTAITELTGISNDMVADAPKFYEVARKVVELTDGAVFVAHNVRFDYTFLREEFTRLGFTYTRKHLCTLQMARRCWPGHKSYALNKLCSRLNIDLPRAHRAMDDALATAGVLQLALAEQTSAGETQTPKPAKSRLRTAQRESLLPGGLSLKRIQELPAACGVYYFLNRKGRVVYVGKSQNIRRRVREHFGTKDFKGLKLHNQVHSVRYQLTGSEIVALLLESYEIKRLLPPINRAQRRRHFPFVLHRFEDERGVYRLEVCRPTPEERRRLDVVAEYGKLGRAKATLQFIQQEYELCGRYLGLEQGKENTPCFHYHLKSCRGVCFAAEEPAGYNDRVLEAVNRIKTVFGNDFFIIDRGRTDDEQAVILVENGRYRGYGYRPKPRRHVPNPCKKKLRAVIKPFPGNPETARIIRRFLNSDHELQIVSFEREPAG